MLHWTKIHCNAPKCNVFLSNSMMSSYCFWMISILKKFILLLKVTAFFVHNKSLKSTEMIQNRTTTRFAFDGWFLKTWIRTRYLQVCISFPILYRALGQLLITTLATNYANTGINRLFILSLWWNIFEGNFTLFFKFFPSIVTEETILPNVFKGHF